MPNWCENKIIISPNGDNDELPKGLTGSILDKNGDLTFSLLMSPPEANVESQIQWCVENWGTKWEPSSSEPFVLDEETGEVRFDVETAWSPPLEFMEYLSSVFPDVIVEIKYIEFGMNFMGSCTYIAGLVIEEDPCSDITLEKLLELGNYSEEDIINMGYSLED